MKYFPSTSSCLTAGRGNALRAHLGRNVNKVETQRLWQSVWSFSNPRPAHFCPQSTLLLLLNNVGRKYQSDSQARSHPSTKCHSCNRLAGCVKHRLCFRQDWEHRVRVQQLRPCLFLSHAFFSRIEPVCISVFVCVFITIICTGWFF